MPYLHPMTAPRTAEARPTRHLTVAALIALVVVYLAVIQGIGWLMSRGLDAQYAAPTTIDELWRGMTFSIALSVVLVSAILTMVVLTIILVIRRHHIEPAVPGVASH